MPPPSPATPSSTCTAAARWRSPRRSPLDGRDDLSLAYTPGRGPGLRGDRRRPARWSTTTPGSSQHRRGRHRRHRRARPGRHRPGGRDAGDGGQGGAVQAVRRRGRRADLPGHHRTSTRSSRPSSRLAPELRRHQPRGHLRAALLRDRAAAQGAARHPGLPRRPARHRGRRARRAARTRCGSPAASSTSTRVVISGAGAAGVAVARILLAAGVGDLAVADRRGVLHSGRGDLTPVKLSLAARHRRPDRSHRRARRRAATAPTSSSASPAAPSPRRPSRRMAADAIIFALANPTPEVHPDVAAPARRGGRHRPLGLPEPDQQRARVPRHLPRRLRRPAPPRSPRA